MCGGVGFASHECWCQVWGLMLWEWMVGAESARGGDDGFMMTTLQVCRWPFGRRLVTRAGSMGVYLPSSSQSLLDILVFG